MAPQARAAAMIASAIPAWLAVNGGFVPAGVKPGEMDDRTDNEGDRHEGHHHSDPAVDANLLGARLEHGHASMVTGNRLAVVPPRA